MKITEMPKFGPLAGVKVITSGISVGGPYGGAMMADFGAEVIYIESPFIKDHFRTTDTKAYINKERRNQRTMALNFAEPEGKEIFFKLIKDADIFIENSKAGQWNKRGLGDDVLWQVNPKLVISHVTGFGQTGDPEYLRRGAYDSIGQAFSGYMNLNGEPDGDPMPGPAYVGDYAIALLSSWACLAALYNAQKTGKGESIDCAQFEALLMIQAAYPSDWLTYKFPRPRNGAKNPSMAGVEPFKCKDGSIYVQWQTENTYRHCSSLIGLEYGTELIPDGIAFAYRGTPAGDLVIQRLTEYCASRTVSEAEKEFNDHNCTASAIMTYEQMEDHPHYKARGVFTEWEGIDGDRVKGPAIAPRMKNNPGQIWKRAPHYGEDNEDILAELGYTPEQIKAFYEKKVLAQDLTC